MKAEQPSHTIGLCVVLDNNNYGSMLQSLASQRLVENAGFRVELLRFRKRYTPMFILKSIPRLLNQVTRHEKHAALVKKRYLQKHPVLAPAVAKRAEAFARFRKQYFTAPIHTCHGYAALHQQVVHYHALLTGSDQLWSPSGLATHFYDLSFAPKTMWTVSYASSFGVEQIPFYQRGRTAAFLQRLNAISMRENSGAQIVKALTGKNVPVVADPTLMFDAHAWANLLPCEPVVAGDYIFTYFLSEDPSSRAVTKQLQLCTGLCIVCIPQYVDADADFGDVIIHDAGPAEFVSLIRNATYICTDSFHGTVFSILHHKPFVVFDRYPQGAKVSKNTRIVSLCDNLGLVSRRFSGNIAEQIAQPIDYGRVEAALATMREASAAYLDNALRGVR